MPHGFSLREPFKTSSPHDWQSKNLPANFTSVRVLVSTSKIIQDQEKNGKTESRSTADKTSRPYGSVIGIMTPMKYKKSPYTSQRKITLLNQTGGQTLDQRMVWMVATPQRHLTINQKSICLGDRAELSHQTKRKLYLNQSQNGGKRRTKPTMFTEQVNE